MSERLKGRIKFYSGPGRYGFIICNDQEVYFREQDVNRSVTELNPDDKVEFTLVPGMKGPRGVNIKKI